MSPRVIARVTERSGSTSATADALGQIVDDGHESSTSAGMSDSMPSTGMPSAIFSSMPAEAGELVLQLPRAIAHGLR